MYTTKTMFLFFFGRGGGKLGWFSQVLLYSYNIIMTLYNFMLEAETLMAINNTLYVN